MSVDPWKGTTNRPAGRAGASAGAMTAETLRSYGRGVSINRPEVPMTSTKTIAGVAGLTFPALALATFGAPAAPTAGASPHAVVAYFSDHSQAALVVSALTLLALAPLMVFATGVSEEARDRPWSRLAVGGATGIAAGTLVATGINTALALAADSWLPRDPLLAKALFDVQAAIFPGIGVFAAAFLVGVVVPARADGWMPRWVAAAGVTAAAVELVSVPIGVVPASPVFSALSMPGYLLVVLWMISTSIVLLRTPSRAAVPVTTTA